MYKIKDRYKNHIAKYAHTKLDINGIYDKETWNKAGFKDQLLDEVSKYDAFIHLYPDFKGTVDYYTNNADTITFINVAENTIEYSYSFVAECGCCSDCDNDTEDLKWYLNNMDITDFNDLINSLK